MRKIHASVIFVSYQRALNRIYNVKPLSANQKKAAALLLARRR